MLAQNFKSPAELHLTDAEHAALVTVLGMLERGEATHLPLREYDYKQSQRNQGEPIPSTMFFNMREWSFPHHCGTVCCIGGLAEAIGGLEFGPYSSAIENLFYPPSDLSYDSITTDQAATALRSFLTTGQVDWYKIVKNDAIS